MRIMMVKHLASWSDVMKIVKGLSKKKHRQHGYTWEIEDLEQTASHVKLAGTEELFNDGYSFCEPIFLIKVFKE